MEQNVWYQNGGGLTLELCEDDNMKSDDTVEECEACNEAKYEVCLLIVVVEELTRTTDLCLF